MSIRQLAPDVAAKIAAGEVVERPASVVKELIENSIDAGATSIRVDLVNGGLQLIRVTDNGSGIASEELMLALSRHATSKVTLIDDLEHISSLGFRGEALASIAAVADVTLASRHKDASQGAQIHALNGELSSVTTAASPEGTTLTVRNLFSAVPARLKFLKSRNTEINHCLHLLEQYALAYPGIRFSVSSESRQIFATPGDDHLTSALVEIYGLKITEQMVEISSLDGNDDDPERPIVTGYTSLPSCYKSTRQHMSFFVNRRWVLSRVLNYAVEEAYHSLLLPGRHPITVVNIAVDPTQIDVNVHPAKTEIRFLKERRVYAAVLRAVRNAVLAEATSANWSGHDASSELTEIPESAPTASEVVELQEESIDADALPQDSPWLTVTEEESGSKPRSLSRLWQSHVNPRDHTKSSDRSEDSFLPALEDEPDFEFPFTPDKTLLSTKQAASSPKTVSDDLAIKRSTASSQSLRDDVSAEQIAPSAQSVRNNVSAEQIAPSSRSVRNDVPIEQSMPESDVDLSHLADLFPARGSENSASLTPIEAGLPQQGDVSKGQGRLPSLRVIGQLAQSYIVTEGQEGLYLIDQHAAHERILMEKMVAALQARDSLSQLLLTPMTLELAPAELGAIEDHLTHLEHIGFQLDFQETSVVVNAVPQVLVKQMNTRSLAELLTELTAPESLGHSETWEEHALANVACKAAIKANYFLTVSEMREMLSQLAQTKAPYSCCHGRPTTVRFSLGVLEREFGRR